MPRASHGRRIVRTVERLLRLAGVAEGMAIGQSVIMQGWVVRFVRIGGSESEGDGNVLAGYLARVCGWWVLGWEGRGREGKGHVSCFVCGEAVV